MVETVGHQHPTISIECQVAGSVQQMRGRVPCRVLPDQGQSVSSEFKNALETDAGPAVADEEGPPRSFDGVVRGVHIPREAHPSKEGPVGGKDLEDVRPAFGEDQDTALGRHGHGEWFPESGHPPGGLCGLLYHHLPDTAAGVIGDV